MDALSFLKFDPDFSSPRILTAYDELPLWSAMFGLLLLDELPLANMRRVLDVGCGAGFPLIELAERLGPGSEVYGIDPWTAGLKRASEKIASRDTPNVTLHEGSASAMPFPDASFDLIVSNLGVNNFDDRAAVMRECRRVARPSATLAITTNLEGQMKEFYAIFEEVLRNERDDAAIRRLQAHVEHRGTVASVRNLLTDGGFTVTRVVEREGQMRFANGTALLNHHFIKLRFLDGWKTVVPNSEPRTFSELRRRLDEVAKEKGELRLTIPMAYFESVAP
jgi:arsenite methyltransferase